MKTAITPPSPLLSAAGLAGLPAATLARIVIRLAAAMEDLLRGGADGSTSGDRILRASHALDAAYGLRSATPPRPAPKWLAVMRTIPRRDFVAGMMVGASLALIIAGVHIAF